MNPFAWLIGLVLPACGFPAAEGLPTPVLMNVTHITRPSTPNTALAAPPGFVPTPDLTTPPYSVTADALFALIESVAGSQPRTYQAASFPGERQVHYVARTPLFNFPDLVMVQVRQDGPGRSDLIVYSRSVYGRSDLGVNRRRVETWLAALQTRITSPNER
ncbi:MAG TPA: DUF1499 domain-containing protein [Rhodopila sp.]